MPDFFRPYWLAIRRWPMYSGLILLILLGFGWTGLRGARILGDDNESTESAGGAGNSLTGRGGSHGGHGTFYHK